MEGKFGANSSQKLTVILVVVILSILLYIMNQIPPSGQWLRDANAPVFPTIRYKGINEPFGTGYPRSAEQRYRGGENRFLYSKPVDREDAVLMEHSLFANPRMMSAKDTPDEALPTENGEVVFDPNTGNVVPAPPVQSTHTAPPANDNQDLLRAGEENAQDGYMNSFGTARGGS